MSLLSETVARVASTYAHPVEPIPSCSWGGWTAAVIELRDSTADGADVLANVTDLTSQQPSRQQPPRELGRDPAFSAWEDGYRSWSCVPMLWFEYDRSRGAGAAPLVWACVSDTILRDRSRRRIAHAPGLAPVLRDVLSTVAPSTPHQERLVASLLAADTAAKNTHKDGGLLHIASLAPRGQAAIRASFGVAAIQALSWLAELGAQPAPELARVLFSVASPWAPVGVQLTFAPEITDYLGVELLPESREQAHAPARARQVQDAVSDLAALEPGAAAMLRGWPARERQWESGTIDQHAYVKLARRGSRWASKVYLSATPSAAAAGRRSPPTGSG